jgi:hypothetical protein
MNLDGSHEAFNSPTNSWVKGISISQANINRMRVRSGSCNSILQKPNSVKFWIYHRTELEYIIIEAAKD